MFSGLWSKISAFLAAFIGFLVVKSKIQRREIEKLEEEVEMNNKMSAITDEMKLAQEQAKREEKDEQSQIDDPGWSDHI